jgi:hypothetical protein
MYLWLVNPFWALVVKRLTTSFSLLLIARDITLYKQLNNEIGRHLLMSLQSPFLGINLKTAVLKDLVNLPF